MTRLINLSYIAFASVLFTACTSSATPKQAQSPSFTSGSHDGCTTAKGEYTKDSASFNNDKDYQDGWFYGRKKCNPSQVK